MIGQDKLFTRLNTLGTNLPRFTIIYGAKGSGKKTFCKELAKSLNMKIVSSGLKMEDIRTTIDLAYTQVIPVIYLIPDADTMNINAKNALLKITEEPPQKAFFMMTLENLDNTLQTIISRATSFSLDEYSKTELLQFREYRGYSNKYDDIMLDLCNTTGQVDQLFGYDVPKFYDFINHVIKNINTVHSSNVLKISKMLDSKDPTNGYDAEFFFSAIRNMFLKLGKKKASYLKVAILTGDIIRKLRNISLNRTGLCDIWIMTVREVLNADL